jgi:hypothetical protein
MRCCSLLCSYVGGFSYSALSGCRHHHGGRKVTTAGVNGDNHIRGTGHRDVIASPVEMTLSELREAMTSCCGGRVSGYVRSRPGPDRLLAGPGPGSLVGGGGRDVLKGNARAEQSRVGQDEI